MVTLVRIALRLIEDALRWVLLLFSSTESVHAENLFLRRQLALYIERGVGLHFCGAQSKAAASAYSKSHPVTRQRFRKPCAVRPQFGANPRPN